MAVAVVTGEQSGAGIPLVYETETHDITSSIMAKGSIDEDHNNNDLDPDSLAQLRTALANLDLAALRELSRRGLCGPETVTDNNKYYNPLHELLLSYVTLPLLDAIRLRHKLLECVAFLLDVGIDVNDVDIGGNTVLHILSQHPGHAEVIRTLLENGASVDAINRNQHTALHLAAEAGGTKDVDTLLEGGADPNRLDNVGHSPLHKAVRYRRNGEVVKSLVGCGGNIDLQLKTYRSKGPTPLHVAVSNGRHDNVKLLVELGSKLDVEDASGQTPLHLAAGNDISGDIVRTLVEAGANMDQRDSVYGETPLHKALARSLPDSVAILCENRADPNSRDLQGETPLHHAAAHCRDLGIWMRILNTKADPQIRNLQGMTPLDKANRAGNSTAGSILRQMTS